MKKFVSLLVALLLAMPSIALAGTHPVELPIAEDGHLTIAVYDNYYAAASYAEPLPVLEHIEEVTGVQIDWDVVVPSQYDEVMQVRLAAGVDLPDIVQIPGGLNGVGTYAANGILIPLDELFAQYAPNIEQLIYEDIPQLGMIYTADDGHIYHIAQNYYGGNMVEVKGLILRTDWLETLNLEMPETIDDWYNVLKAFATQDPNGNGLNDEIALTSFDLSGYGYFASAFGLVNPANKYIEKDGKAICQYDEPGYKDYLMWLNKLYSEGIMDQAFITGDEAKLDAMCAKDIVGCAAHYATKSELWAGTAKSGGNPNSGNAEYHLVLSPKGPDGTLEYESRTLTGFCYGVTRDCEDPVLAVKWLDYIYGSDEGRDMMNYGVEGITYTLDENGNKQWVDYVANNPDGLNISSALRSLGAFPAQFTNRTVDFYEMMTSKQAAEEGAVLREYFIDPFPQIMATETEIDRIASLSADINTYESEMIQKFIMGQESFDNWDNFRQTVAGMGGDELNQIYQDQVDRYYAKAAK